MTALAYSPDTAWDREPALDYFDDDYFDGFGATAPARPQLRLLQGQAVQGQPVRGQAGQRRNYGLDAVVAGVQGSAAPQTARALEAVEVYRRRRFLALVAATVLILGIAWAAGVSVLSFGAAGAPAAETLAETLPEVHVVLPGDTYAAIASDLGAANPNVMAAELRAANGGGELVVGQRLVVNVGASQISG